MLYKAYQTYLETVDLEMDQVKDLVAQKLNEEGFGNVEEAIVAFVRDCEIVFTCYVCKDVDDPEPADYIKPDDITLGGDINPDSIVILV